MKIMFICTGNICRSAMAHKLLQEKAKENNKNINVYSCGLFAENGDYPTNQAIKVMREKGIDLSLHRATNIRNSNIEDMDIILCATVAHKNHVINMYPELKEKVYTIKEYVGYDKSNLDINDPWGFSEQVYERCLKEIEECLNKIIKKI